MLLSLRSFLRRSRLDLDFLLGDGVPSSRRLLLFALLRLEVEVGDEDCLLLNFASDLTSVMPSMLGLTSMGSLAVGSL